MTSKQSIRPPKYAEKFLTWVLKKELTEEVLGDLEEKFYKKIDQQSPFRAKANYWYQTLNYLRPFAIKNSIITDLNPFFMWQHHLKITFRKFQRNKTSFGINLIGLSTGLACALMIFLWVQDELNVDTFNVNNDRLYKVMHNFEMQPGEILTWERTSKLLAPALVEELPEVAAATCTNSSSFVPKGILKDREVKTEITGLFADKEYFNVFSYDLIEGDKQRVLLDKSSIVISESTARKLFNTPTEAMGKTLKWKTRFFDEDFQVTGVYENPPVNATRQFDAVVPFDLLVDWDRWAGDWTGDYAQTYVVVKEGTEMEAFNEKLGPFLKPKSEWRKSSTLFAHQYANKYLYGNYENGQIVGGRIAYVQLFSLIAFFILIIACINFMNLSTAQATTKMKEIGVKKAIGARRKSLIAQFLGESTILAFLSLGVALAFVSYLLPQFNALTGKALNLSLELPIVLAILGITVFTGLVAGSYPALYLSGFTPIAVLKGKLNTSWGEEWARKGLVTFQFVLTLIFIVSVLVIHQQIEFTQTKNLGYNRDNIITFTRVKNTGDPQVFLDQIRNIPTVLSAGNMNGKFLEGSDNQGGYSWRGEEEDKKRIFPSPRVGYEFMETMGMELVAGRTFSRELKDDDSKVIINETALKMMQLTDPVGTIFDRGEHGKQEVIGVVKDFHYGSIHHKVEPTIVRFRDFGRDISVRIKAGEESATIPKIAAIFKDFHPDYDFNYSFLDTDYQQLYESESRVGTLSKYFSGLAILISCLGLFGLAMFTAERRKKEIGIRKVLGASVFGIVQMLTKDFTKTVIVAILIATPLSYLIGQSWLANFAYRIDLQSWYFIVPSLLILLVAWSTVGLQIMHAARVNPVHSLKDE